MYRVAAVTVAATATAVVVVVVSTDVPCICSVYYALDKCGCKINNDCITHTCESVCVCVCLGCMGCRETEMSENNFRNGHTTRNGYPNRQYFKSYTSVNI